MATEFFDHKGIIPVIMAIYRNPGCTEEEIAFASGCPIQTVEADIRVLMKCNLVIADAIGSVYTVTEKGAAVAFHLLRIGELMSSPKQ